MIIGITLFLSVCHSSRVRVRHFTDDYFSNYTEPSWDSVCYSCYNMLTFQSSSQPYIRLIQPASLGKTSALKISFHLDFNISMLALIL